MDQIKKKLRIGLDLDGVLLYNPLRVARPIVALIKKIFKVKRGNNFYIPTRTWEKWLFFAVHELSLFTPAGFRQILDMAEAEEVELYLITARYSFLKHKVYEFVHEHNAAHLFKRVITNESDEQPHLYKERVIRDLDLDYFVEDNWNIVQHLSQTTPKTKVLWMYNFLDRHIPYPHKFPHLLSVYKYIRSKI